MPIEGTQSRKRTPHEVSVDAILAAFEKRHWAARHGWKKTPGRSGAEQFAALVAIEPRLNDLLDAARQYAWESRDSEVACANARWHGGGRWQRHGLKDRLTTLVGYEAENQLLGTEDAYEVACDHIYAALPDCRNCLCP